MEIHDAGVETGGPCLYFSKKSFFGEIRIFRYFLKVTPLNIQFYYYLTENEDNKSHDNQNIFDSD